MSDLASLVASYLDLPREEAEEALFTPGADDEMAAWGQARLAALRSIAHAAEDLELDALADEIDRTMLLDTIRFDMHQLRHALAPMEPAMLLDGWLAALADVPIGVRGTLRLLASQREEVAAQVAGVATVLGATTGAEAVQMLREETRDGGWVIADGWVEEWQRTTAHLQALGLPVAPGDAPPLPDAMVEEWSFATLALRAQAIRMFEQARQAQRRPSRQRLLARGLLNGWGRTVCTVLAETPLFDLPERRLMMWWRGLHDAVTAELELAYLAGVLAEDHVISAAVARLGEADAPAVAQRVLATTGDAVAAALAEEQWFRWWREAVAGEGLTSAAWVRQALMAGGLSVRLARWAQGEDADESR